MLSNYKTYPEFDYIEVSDSGIVRTKDRIIKGKGNSTRFRKGRVLIQTPSKKGYPEVRISGSPRCVHKLVMLTFVGERPTGMHINHKNGIKTDNSLENLEWISPSGNIKHAFDMGIQSNKGEKNPRAKLNAIDVETIRTLYSKENYTQRQLANIYLVNQTTISQIVRRTSWN